VGNNALAAAQLCARIRLLGMRAAVALKLGLADVARHVIGPHLIPVTRVQIALDHVTGNWSRRYCSPRQKMTFTTINEGQMRVDDVARNIYQALRSGPGRPSRACFR